MKKILFASIFLFSITIQADYLNTKTNKCVYDLIPYHSQNKGWCYTKRSDDSAHCSKTLKYTHFINGFYIDNNGNCIMFEDLQKTGMTYSQFQFQEALLANMFGFFIFFLVGFLFVLQGRR